VARTAVAGARRRVAMAVGPGQSIG
jgi:hypothetical protein